MTWKERFEQPKQISTISELKVGDLISYTSSNRVIPRWAVIYKFEDGTNIWGTYRNTKKEALLVVPNATSYLFIKDAKTLFKHAK
ncbi:MAG: hypothetical protein ACTSQE_17310 [Candidatus Heimdallarchaeaceae archaeon]